MANNQIALLAQVPEFDTPVESQGKALKIRDMMNQTQANDLDLQQKREAIQQAAGLRATLAGFKPETSVDEQVGTLTRAGHMSAARSLAESAAKVNKDKREAEKFQFEQAREQIGFINQVIAAAKDQASYSQGRQLLAARGMDVSQIPEQFDPEYVRTAGAQTMTELQRLDQIWKEEGFDQVERKFAYQQQNDAENRRVTIRGQDKQEQASLRTDRRAEQGRKDALTKPFEVTGPDGVPVLVQQSKEGIVPVEGYTPKRAVAKPLAPAVVKQLQEARENATTMDRLNTSFKDNFASKGILGMGADMQLSAAGTLGADQDAVAWWKDYRKQAELVERHALFGAALTPTEQASWRSADIGPGMAAATIKTNLATRAALSKKIRESTKQDMIDAGHNADRVSSIADRDAGPVRVASAADYEKLKPGTEYVDPNGQTRRKP